MKNKREETTRKSVVLEAAFEAMKERFASFVKDKLKSHAKLTEEDLKKFFFGYNELQSVVSKKLQPKKDKLGEKIQTVMEFNIHDAFFFNSLRLDDRFDMGKIKLIKSGEIITTVFPMSPLELAAELNITTSKAKVLPLRTPTRKLQKKSAAV